MSRMAARALARLTALLALVLALAPAARAQDAPPAAWAPVAGLNLTEPQQVYAKDGVLRVTLDAEQETITVSDSQIVAQPFNGSLVGPTLHVRPGDAIEVTFRNATPQDTNIHFHGLHVSPKGHGDNVFRSFSPGTTVRSRVVLPKDHSPGTFWYHAHFHGLTEQQLMGGMSGLIVVDGLQRLLPKELRGIEERQLAIRDLQVAPGSPGSAALVGSEIDPTKATTRLVNGLLLPRTTLRSGETQLWRLANIGSDLFYDVELAGHRLTVIAEDGSPVWRTYRARHLVMPPGKRFDVLVEGGAPGSYDLRTRAYPQEGFQLLPRTDLATVEVVPGDGQAAAAVPRRLDTPAGPIMDRPAAKRRTFTFSFGTGKQFTALINGQVFDPAKTNVAPVVDTVEEWTLRNTSDEEHPFHIHVNDFQVVSVNGKRYRAHNLQDVVTIPKQEHGKPGEVVIRIPFDDFTGHFVFHCHILGHEDAGMMMTVQVRRKGQRPTPPPGAHAHAHHRLHAAPARRSVAARGSTPAWLCRLRERRLI
ncbi:MAG TPA: multicopper oxidase family protein [Capillimicrobium sp.]|nr:multicopper oxidase family protein [Capillimicrobium sp.]